MFREAVALLPLSIATLSLVAPRTALADCYVDSLAGDDQNDGLSESTPFESQAAITAGCKAVHYKRGSAFDEAVRIVSGVTTYTNYGDSGDPPRFVVPHTTNSGSVVSSYQGNVTIDGLYLAGSKGDGTMAGLTNGVCVALGSNSQLLNSEITNCDIGMMLSGEGSLVQGNYFHDMTMAVDGDTSVDPNSVGGAEGLFVQGSNNEIAYNTFINCTDMAEWTGGSCDGGATEVTVGAGKTVSGVKIHHNFSYNNCGFFEVSSMAGGDLGTFADSEFYNNVHVDGGWLMLLQVNNTHMSNIRWDNNTVVQHAGSPNAGMVTTIFTGTSSGVSGGELTSGTVSMTNNMVIFDGVTPFGDVIDPAITQLTNLIIDGSSQDPGVVNLAGNTATDFDLVAGSPAIDQGTLLAERTQDFLNRAIPDASGTPDVGAFEYGSGQTTQGPEAPTGTGGTGTSTSTAGATVSDAGGTSTDPEGNATGGGSSAATAPDGTGNVTSAPTGGPQAVASTQPEMSAEPVAPDAQGGCSCSLPEPTRTDFAGWAVAALLVSCGYRRRSNCE